MADTEFTVDQAVDTLIASGKYKPKTEYLAPQGDEPVGVAALDLEAMIDKTQVEALKTALVNIPRSKLKEFFDKKIWVDIPTAKTLPVVFDVKENPLKYYQKLTRDPNILIVNNVVVNISLTHKDLLWGAIIELFNTVNLDFTLNNMISPESWEKQKLDAYTVSQNPQSLQKFKDAIQRSVDVSKDPKAVPILEAYLKLAPLGDKGLEINRQNAIRQLLIQKEYESAQAVIDAYTYASQTMMSEALAKPLPYDVVSSSGQVMAKKQV